MYNEWFSHMSKTIQKDILFLLVSSGACKNEFVFQFTYLQPQFVYRNTCATYSHKH